MEPHMPDMQQTGAKTIEDFGEQWTAFPENTGYYASYALFLDFLSGLIDVSELVGRRVADIGSGTGRIVGMLLQAGAGHVTGVEPSAAVDVLRRRFSDQRERVTCLRITGDQLPADQPFDLIFSFGVLHHIPDPAPTIRAAYAALKPGGKIVIWLYGREGNRLYLAFALPLRRLAHHLPHAALTGLSWMLWAPLRVYTALCRALPLPMHRYLRQVYARLRAADQMLVIYDQLNPAYAKYYNRQEAVDCLAGGGFVNIRLANRHGYGWTVVGQKPGDPAGAAPAVDPPARSRRGGHDRSCEGGSADKEGRPG